jgi:GNAT superfamily N-acetyltransferase
VWQLRGRFDTSHALYAIEEDDRVVGALWFQGEELLFDILPANGSLLPQLLDAAIQKARRAGSKRLYSSISDDDLYRQTAIAAAGFSREGPSSVRFERDLMLTPPAPLRIEGILLRDCVDIDPEARAEVHRAAWSALDHIGIKGNSTFSANEYLSLNTGGIYDPRSDIVAETADGRLVATATAWADVTSGTAVFEPVGVRPEFRGRRLMAAVMTEAMVRMAATGVRKARVATAHFNSSAIASYARAFDRVDTTTVWSRAL